MEERAGLTREFAERLEKRLDEFKVALCGTGTI